MNSLIQKFMVVLFIGFSIISYLFKPIDKMNQDIFISGSLIYLTAYITISIKKLKEEKFDFFTSNHFILISSPILFFLGMTFIFSFKSKALNDTEICFGLSLYGIIILIVNIIYYSLINLYIYKEYQQKNAT